MADNAHIALLKTGRDSFHEWRKTHQNEKLDLSGADLQDLDLSGYHLVGANLKSAVLDRAVLNDTRLDKAILDDASLNGATLTGASFRDAKLSKAGFVGAIADRAFFSNATAIEANFTSSSLNGATFENATLTKALFIKIKAESASFNQAGLNEADLTDANCRRARFEGSRLNNATISQADFFEAVFNATSFSEVAGAETAMNLETTNCLSEMYFENCKRHWIETYCDWESLKRFGRQPLFALSYSVLIFIPIYFYLIAWYNAQVDAIRQWGEKVGSTAPHYAELANGHLHHLPIPSLSFLLLVSTILLAIASTIYTFGCPARIKEFSKEIWCNQLGKPLVHYWPLSWKSRALRVSCGACYLLGGAGALYVLIAKIANVIPYIWRHSSL